MREILADGAYATGEIAVSACQLEEPPDIAIAVSGTFLVVGEAEDSSGSGVGGKLFAPDGAPLGSEFLINETTGFQNHFRVVALPSTRFAVVWDDSNAKVHGRVVMEDGAMPFPEQEVPENPSVAAWAPDITEVPGGGIAVVWIDDTTYPFQDLRLRFFDEQFTPLGGDVVVSPANRDNRPSLDAWPGGLVVAWERSTASNVEVVARWLDLAGNPLTPEVPVNTYTNYIQGTPHCAADATGRTVITWGSQAPEAAMGRLFDASGNPLTDDFQVNGSFFGYVGSYDVEMTPDGDFIPVFTSRQDNDSPDSFMRRYFFPMSLVVGSGPGSGNRPTAQVVQPDGRSSMPAFEPYAAPGFGANVGAGDVDGDGLAEVLTGPGPSGAFGPQVRGYERDGAAMPLVNYFAYGTLKFGVRVAAGELERDRFDEILTAPGEGAIFGPHLRGWDYDADRIRAVPGVSFYAYGTLKWGARAAAGDVDGDMAQELLSAPGPGIQFAPHVRGWDYDGGPLVSMPGVNLFAWSTGRYGATVAAADVESDGEGTYRDGYQEIVVGRGPEPGVAPQARLFDVDAGAATEKDSFGATYSTTYGMNVAGGDVDAGDIEEVVTAPGPDPTATARVIVWEWEPGVGNAGYEGIFKLGPDDFEAFPGSPAMTHGGNVAVGTFE